MTEYRQDDQTIGYCPVCAQPLSAMTIDARGYCEEHGWRWANWLVEEEIARQEAVMQRIEMEDSMQRAGDEIAKQLSAETGMRVEYVMNDLLSSDRDPGDETDR